MWSKAAAPVLFGRGSGDHVLIESSHKIVSGWLQVQISVCCGGLSANFPGQFQHGELHRFGKDIEDLCKNERCTAALRPQEAYLVLMLASGGGNGMIHVSGEARQKPGSRNVLTFEFEMEQSELQVIANTLVLADRTEK